MDTYEIYIGNKESNTYSRGYILWTYKQAELVAEGFAHLLRQGFKVYNADSEESCNSVYILRTTAKGERKSIISIYPEEI